MTNKVGVWGNEGMERKETSTLVNMVNIQLKTLKLPTVFPLFPMHRNDLHQ